MPDSTTYIKKIEIGGIEYPIDASKLEGHAWQDILDLVEAGFEFKMSWSEARYAGSTAPDATALANIPQGVKVKYNDGASESLLGGTLVADSSIKNNIYLVCVGSSSKSVYDEYAVVGSTTSATGYQWERLGSTDVDLSNYPTKDVAGKAGTYSTSAASTETTGSGGAQQASGAATITIPATTMTSTSAGGHTINGSNFSFSGSTGTITIGNNSNDNVWIDKHKYQPAGTIGGSQSVGAHSHTVTKSTTPFVSTVTSQTTTVATGELSGTPGTDTFVKGITSSGTSVLTGVKVSSSTTAVTGVTTSGSTFVTGYSTTPDKALVVTGVSVNSSDTAVKSITSGSTSVFNSATVSSAGVLSFNSTNVLNTVGAGSTFTAVKGITASGTTYCVLDVPSLSTATALTSASASGTATVATGVGANGTTSALTSVSVNSTASALTGFALATTAVINSISASTANAMTDVSVNNGGGHTINGSNFTFTGTTATLSHGATGTPTTATADQLWVDIATRTINFTPAGSITGSQTVSGHTHSVTFASATITGTAEVAVSNHTHSMGHTHTVTVSNCED